MNRLIGVPSRGIVGADMRADIGPMRERVTLKSVTRAKGTGGFQTDTPVTVQTVPAEVVAEQATEPYEASVQRGQTRYQVRIRYRADVKAAWLVIWRSLTLEVLEAPVNRDGRRRFLWLRCGLVET